jgi:pimeloyl-ACP methyl ester carboxylesterase
MYAQGIFAKAYLSRMRTRPTTAKLLVAVLLILGWTLTVIPVLAQSNQEPADQSPDIAADDDGLPPNLPLPTMGGRQLWQDVAYHAGWRLQRHVWTDHFRLLDPGGWRQAWGDEPQIRPKFETLQRDPNLTHANDHLVILLHGWGRTHAMFGEMKTALEAESFEVLAFSYPSTRAPISAHAAALEDLIANLRGIRRVSFVTHSLGGLVLRRMLAETPTFTNGVALHRAVLVAAPNQGAELAEILQDFPPLHWIGGPVAAELTPRAVAGLPAPSIPFIVVSGVRDDEEGWNPLVAGDDDGVVSLEETQLEGAEESHIVNALHTFVATDPETIRLTLEFLGADAAPDGE